MTAAVLTFPDLSPEIFSIDIGSFHFALRWYALAYIAGILIAWRMAVAAVKAARLWPGDTAPMSPRQIEDMLTWIILGVILGGRIGFVVFYEPAYYFTHPLDILKVWNGGMAFHGGLIGVIVAAWIYTRVHRIPQLQAADLIAYAVPPGLLLGRLANFVNGELWGRASDLPWAMVFPDPRSRYCEGFAEPCARHPSQLYEAGLEGILLGTLLILLVWRFGALKAPGRVCGIFFAGYGMARFIVEFFRQPDAQFVTPGNPLGLAWQVGGYGLTQGQALSLPMIAFGIWLALRARRKA
ncbi:MAG: prolipoprotein diacylglyceryl transferase [Rhodobacteraceae bacterium]|nr:prolipoprotein diacylglyceryl transferase [Paracoccaceae bacterium]MAY45571.1 prolipoprotein diacylglyceryl transferase [Paracoccaceae bacterium]